MTRSTSPPPTSSSLRKIRHDRSPDRHRHHLQRHQYQPQHPYKQHCSNHHSRSYHGHNFHVHRHFQPQNQYRQHRAHSPSSKSGPSDSRHTRSSSKYSHRDGHSSSSSRHLHKRSSSSNDLRLASSSITISKQHNSHRKSPSCSSGCVKPAQSSRNSTERRSASVNEDPENTSTSNAQGLLPTLEEVESLSVELKSASGDAGPAVSKSVEDPETAFVSEPTSSHGLTSTCQQESVELSNKGQIWRMACAMAHAYLYQDLSFDRSMLDLNLSLNLNQDDEPMEMDLNLEPNEEIEHGIEPMDVPMPESMPSLEAMNENERNTDDEREIDLNISLATVVDVRASVSEAIQSFPSGNVHLPSAGTNVQCSNICVAADVEKCARNNISTFCTDPSLTMTTTTTSTTREEEDEEIVCIDEVVNPTQAAEWFGMQFSCTAALVS